MDHEGFDPPTISSLDECSTTELMVPNLEKIGRLGTFFETLLNHLHTHTRCLDSGLKILVRIAHVAGLEPPIILLRTEHSTILSYRSSNSWSLRTGLLRPSENSFC